MARTPNSRSSSRPAAPLGRVLVVDDEVELMSTLRELLTAQGYAVEGVTSGEAALVALREGEFDLLLTDLMMPGMDGIALLQAGLELDPHLVGIIMTGQGTVQTAVDAMKVGAFDYVLKPFKLSAVLPVLSRAMGVRQLRLENLQLRETVAIYDLSKTIAFTLDLHEILNKLADAALQQCEADEATVMLPTQDGRELYVAAVRGGHRGHILGERVSIEQGIAGWVARHREPLLLHGKIDDPRFAPVKPRTDIQSAICMPLQAGNTFVGLLNVNATRRRRRFTLGQVKALTILSTTGAVALEDAQLFAKVQQAEEKYRTIFNDAIEGIFQASPDGRFMTANPSLARMLGYESPEDLMASVTDIDRQLYADPQRRAEFVRLLREEGRVSGFESSVRRKDGTLMWVLESARAVRADGGALRYYEGSVVDITTRKQAEEQVERQLETLIALYASAQKLSQSLDLQQLVRYVVETCVRVFGAHRAWVGRAEPHGSLRLLDRFPADSRFPPADGPAPRWDDSPEGRAPPGRAISSGFPVVTEDVTTDPEAAPWRESMRADGICSLAALPLISRDRPFGLLGMASDRPGFFTPARVEFFQAFAHLVAAALENARLFEETGRRLEQLQALRTIDMAITGSVDLKVTLGVLLEQVTSVLDIDAAGVLLLNPHTQALEQAAGRGFRSRAIERSRLRLGEGYAGRAAVERRVVSAPNLSGTGGDFVRAQLLVGEEFVSYYAAPLVAKGQVKGVLETFHRTARDADQDWLSLLEALAGQAAIAVDNAALFGELQRSNAGLILAYDTTLEGWSRALDLRDKETEGHTQRVAELTMRLGRALGISEQELVHIRRGALLHDIGKMGIPDSILLKPGSLTNDEWVVMKQHPVHAYELLAPIAYLRQALEIPYSHHEKWDGTGYPRGLRGEQIPLAARVFAVVDVWDALTSDRPYRLARSADEALAYIREQAGTHFDPRIAEVFLEMLQQERAAGHDR